ncbi:IS110 family transposase [Burkholderia ubonensis subsp. mesacidophila]|uniref:IS110 family transposase n=1 Tax=Burkholderia ubonensis subsp. mesacidophila TaxID=265293 RepID=A0A2A4F9Q0_9BURK|nr:IS110 family transposase [Burkholderia ubonensis subsp. mesacidophila]
MLAPDQVCVGISVATEIVEISVSSLSAILGYRNETFGIESLTDAIAEWSPALVVLEAAGGFEVEVACALQAVRLPVVVVDPHHARDFVAGAAERPLEGKGVRARVLAELACALVRHPSCGRIAAPLPDPQLRYVQALVQRRRQLARTLVAEYQLLTWCHASVRGGIEQTIAFLKNQIGVVDRHCARHVSAQRADVARALVRVKRTERGALAGRAGEFMSAWRAK